MSERWVLRWLCVAVAAFVAPCVPAAEKVSGRVFLDADRDGRMDPGEEGLPGVRISDGVNIVRTDAEGRYEFELAPDPVVPYRPAQVVSMSWPSGTWPTSQWWRRVKDMPGDRVVNFGLREVRQELPFTIAHATDPHNNFGGEVSARFAADVRRMREAVDMSIVTGDLGYAGVISAHAMFKSVRRFTDEFPVPMFHTVGNHDVVGIHSKEWSKQSEIHGNGAFTKYIGPLRWSFDCAGVHLVGIDWARVEPDGTLETGIPRVAIDWFEKDLALLEPGTRVLVFIHSQYSPDEKFYDLVKKHGVELVLAGHSHRNLDMSIPGTRILTTMNLRGPYRLIQVGDTGLAFINRCTGCKGPEYHSKHCALARAFKNPPETGSGTHFAAGRAALAGEKALGKAAAMPFDAKVSIDPGASKRCGLRLRSAGGADLEIGCADNTLSSGGVATVALRRADQRTYDLHVYLEEGMAKIYANGRVQFEVPFAAEGEIEIAAFAEDGEAVLVSADVWRE